MKIVRRQCRRCEREVTLHFQHGKKRKWAKAYLCIPILFIPFLPIIASDYVVMLPLTMWYALGIGPILAIVTDKPTCTQCGAFVDLRPPAPASTA